MDKRTKLYQFNCQQAADKKKFMDKQQQELLVFLANQEARKQSFLMQININSINPSTQISDCEYVPLPPIPLERQKEEEYRAKAPIPMPKPREVTTIKCLENNISFMKNRSSIHKAKKRLDAKTKIWNKK